MTTQIPAGINDQSTNEAEVRQALVSGFKPWELRAYEALAGTHDLDAYLTSDQSVRGIFRAVKIPKGKLRPNPWNPSVMDAFQKDALDASLSTNGQFQSIVVRPHPEENGAFQIGDGEHRYAAIDEEIVCNVVLGFSTDEFKKLGLNGNLHGHNKKIKLAALLDDLELSQGRREMQYALPIPTEQVDKLLVLAKTERAHKQQIGQSKEDGDGQDDATAESGDVWQVIEAKVPTEVMPVLQRVYSAVQEQRVLNSDPAIAWGQVLECLAADYLAGYVHRHTAQREQTVEAQA